MPRQSKDKGRLVVRALGGGRRAFLAATLLAGVVSAAVVTWPAQAQRGEAGAQPRGDDWIGTWAASPQPVWGPDFPVPLNMPRNLRNQTLRQIAHVSIGGNRVRVVFSNEHGDRPMRIGAAHIALAGEGSAIVQGSDRPLRPSAAKPRSQSHLGRRW